MDLFFHSKKKEHHHTPGDDGVELCEFHIPDPNTLVLFMPLVHAKQR